MIEHSGGFILSKVTTKRALINSRLDATRKGDQLAYFSFGNSRAWSAFTIQKSGKNEIINDALDRTGLINYRDRISTELSGGEQARALLARALAQNTPLILADEPIAGLDPATQLTTMKMFADMAKEGKGF